METEDDTFEKLRRIPFEEMSRLYNNSILSMNFENDSIFIDNGWSWGEFIEKIEN